MGKMKKTPARPRPAADASDDIGDHLQRRPPAQPKKNANSRVDNVKPGAAPLPRKSPVPAEKSKKAIPRSSSSALTAPMGSAKGKESSPHKKTICTSASASSSSGTSGAEEDTNVGEEISGLHGQSEDNLGMSSGPSERLKSPDKALEREISESLCRKQLATLRADDKRPPPPISAETFASTFCLPNAGLNSHKLKIGRDISKEEVEQVFGPEKSKNGFSLAEKLNSTLRKDAERLYCVCYQKPFAPTHVAKEFAIGFVLDKVQKEQVNWAEFAAETNEGQRQSYRRRLRGCMQRLATIVDVPLDDLYKKEGFPEYVDKSREKVSVGDVKCELLLGVGADHDVKPRLHFHNAGSTDPDVLAPRYCTTALPKQCFRVQYSCSWPALMD